MLLTDQSCGVGEAGGRPADVLNSISLDPIDSGVQQPLHQAVREGDSLFLSPTSARLCSSVKVRPTRTELRLRSYSSSHRDKFTSDFPYQGL